MTDNTTEELKGFLAQHETVGKPTLLCAGDVVDGWRVTGFLARGGHAEVYRVERVDAIVSIASSRKADSSSDAFETNASTEVAGFEITPNKRKFPCRFFAMRGKYAVETMIDSIYKKYGIDPNRTPTDAEVELVAYCFDVSESEARSILAQRRAVVYDEAPPQPGRAVSTRPPRTEGSNV